jgi:hypothetical protein
LSKIGIKPDDKVVGKGIIRLQKLVDDLRREVNTIKVRVTNAETEATLLKARVKTLEDA